MRRLFAAALATASRDAAAALGAATPDATDTALAAAARLSSRHTQ